MEYRLPDSIDGIRVERRFDSIIVNAMFEFKDPVFEDFDGAWYATLSLGPCCETCWIYYDLIVFEGRPPQPLGQWQSESHDDEIQMFVDAATRTSLISPIRPHRFEPLVFDL